jgi:hypothetical protein
MARYRKKPIEVEAFLFGVDNMPDWFMDKVTSKDVVLHRIPFDESRARNYGQMYCYIKTLEGTMQAYEGKDYIIKGIKGEIYPCKVDVFESTYEIPTADVAPKSEFEALFEKLKVRECSNSVCAWCVHATAYGRRNEECDKPYIDKNGKEQKACFMYAKFESLIDNELAELRKKYTEEKS